MKKVLHNLFSKEELVNRLAQENFKRKTISFYKYVSICDVDTMRDFLYENFDRLKCLGRIFVAREGINAQMNVPEHNFAEFDNFIQSIPEFSGIPYKFALSEKLPSFIKLIVRKKKKIVADGLDDNSFNPANTGEYVMAEEVNKAIENDSTIIDMRNAYEAEIGHFQGAKIMDVLTFREQLAKVEEVAKEKKNEEVILYCTGGIRCEKASAWMKHRGFKNVKHIKGGIIDYAHQVKEKGLESKFKGKNFVFDERLSEQITDDVITTCHICKKIPYDKHIHCVNQYCHRLFIGCPKCLKKISGHCHWLCKVSVCLPYKWQIRIYKWFRSTRRQQVKWRLKHLTVK